MVFWIFFSLWIIGVILPLGVKLWEPRLEWRWIMLWEFLMFLPLFLGFVLISGLFLLGSKVKIKDRKTIRDMYIPKVPKGWYR